MVKFRANIPFKSKGPNRTRPQCYKSIEAEEMITTERNNSLLIAILYNNKHQFFAQLDELVIFHFSGCVHKPLFLHLCNTLNPVTLTYIKLF